MNDVQVLVDKTSGGKRMNTIFFVLHSCCYQVSHCTGVSTGRLCSAAVLQCPMFQPCPDRCTANGCSTALARAGRGKVVSMCYCGHQQAQALTTRMTQILQYKMIAEGPRSISRCWSRLALKIIFKQYLHALLTSFDNM